MPLNPTHLQHWIDNFYGYGRWDAPVWFIGYEEGGGSDYMEVKQKLDYFYNNWPINPPYLSDIRDLHENVTSGIPPSRAKNYLNHFEYRFGVKAYKDPQSTWKNPIQFSHGFTQMPLPSDLDILNYQKNVLATKNEVLVELFPLPSPRKRDWYYGWLGLPNLHTRHKYEESLFDNRIKYIRSKINITNPKVMVFYGVGSKYRIRLIEAFQKSNQNTNWINCKNEFHYCYTKGQPLIIIIDAAPSSNSKKAKLDWYDLGNWSYQTTNGQNPPCP